MFILMHFALFYRVTLKTKGTTAQEDPKGLRWPSVSFTPHLALSVMKNDKSRQREMD